MKVVPGTGRNDPANLISDALFYSVDPEGLAELRAYVENLWEDVLGAYEEAAGEQ